MTSKTILYEGGVFYLNETLTLMKDVGEGAWYVLSALMAVADEEGVVNTSQGDLAKMIGLSVRTVQRRLNALTEQGLVAKKRTFGGVVYVTTVATRLSCRNPIINNTSLESNKDLKDMGTRQKRRRGGSNVELLFQHWLAVYKSRFGSEYIVSNFGREKGQLKTLLTKYDDDVERLKAIMDVVMRLYDSRWKTNQYLRPTIGAFCSWLAAQAEAYVTTTEDGTDVTDDSDDPFDVHDARFGL